MDIRGIFTREDLVFGLEVSDSALRLGLVSPEQGGALGLVLLEENLLAGTVVGGLIKDEAKFSNTLKKLIARSPRKVDYLIVTIEPSYVYANFFSFPKTIRADRLNETVQLAMGFNLPAEPDQVYLDWEKIAGSEERGLSEIYLQASKKAVINQYVRLLGQLNLKPIAMETRPVSLVRALTKGDEEPLLVIDTEAKSINLLIIAGGNLRFTYPVYKNPTNAKSDKLLNEIRGLINYYESVAKPIKRFASLGPKVTLVEEVLPKLIDKLNLTQISLTTEELWAKNPLIKKDPERWLTVLGVAIRGTIPRSADTIISLLPVGTEQAYRYQKIASFSKLLSNITIGVSSTLILAFLIGWFWLNQLQEQETTKRLILSGNSQTNRYAEVEAKAKAFNATMGQAASFAKNIPHWQPVMAEVLLQLGTDIKLVKLAAPSLSGQLTLNGLATNRASLAAFKSRLESSPILTEVVIPLTNLEQTKDIAFTLSFKIKNPKQFLPVN